MKAPAEVRPAPVAGRPVYFVSDRPEAYEVWGEVNREEAKALARTIADHAGKRFSNVEFRIDGEWHGHDVAMGIVAAYIDSHWRQWAAEMVDYRQTA